MSKQARHAENLTAEQGVELDIVTNCEDCDTWRDCQRCATESCEYRAAVRRHSAIGGEL